MFSKILQHRDTLVSHATQFNAPFFFYDLDACSAHIQQLEKWPVKLWYAVKANPLSAVINTLSELNLGFDVASPGELAQVRAQGVEGARILVTGPAKTGELIEGYLSEGVNTFVLESREQVQALQEVASRLNKKPNALLRVQLVWDRNEKNVLGGGGVTPFGMTPDDWMGIRLNDYPNIDFLGLHIFQWGNIISQDVLRELWQTMIPSLRELADNLQLPLKVLDLGGGLGLQYNKEGEVLLPEQINDVINEIKKELIDTEIWLELGRYAIGSFGYYIAKVMERKKSRGRNLLVLNGGINHILRPAITQQAFPCELTRESNAKQASFSLHGPLCTSLDFLGEHALPNDVEPGDHLVFAQCGAYGFTESMPYFLCHTLPGEVVYSHGQTRVLREPQDPSVWSV